MFNLIKITNLNNAHFRRLLVKNLINLEHQAKMLKCLYRSGFRTFPAYCDIDISHRYRFISFPIPKVASTTQLNIMLTLHMDSEKQRKTRLYERIKYLDYFLYRSRYKHDYYSWTFVRNPWDRLFSCYRFLIHDRIRNNEEPYALSSPSIWRYWMYGRHTMALNTMTFEDFVKYIVKTPDWFLDNHFSPQHYFFDAKKIDFIGRFENYEADMLKLLTIIAPGHRINRIPKTYQSSNSLEKRNYKDYYTDEMREIVARKYARDIKLFNYQF